MTDLPLIWFLIISFELALYVMLDGADLGIGILSLLPQKETHRSLLIHAIGPIWDANETWLIIAGGTLFGAFPLAYGVILNALYIPVFVIVFGLVIRAASFEFRSVSTNKRAWELVFGAASLLSVVGQGLAAGGLLSGIRVINQQFAGGSFNWLTPITLLVTVGVVMSYVVIGYLYLVKKNGYRLEGEHFRHVVIAAIFTLIAFMGTAVLLPSTHYLFFEHWNVEPTRTILLCLSAIIASSSVILCYGIAREEFHRELHAVSMLILGLGFIGLLVGTFPYIIPPGITIYDAAASSATLRFMLWGIGPLLPIVLVYNLYLYHVFHGASADDRSDDY